MTNKNLTRVITGEVRLSYVHLFEPNSIQGSKPKYSTSLIIPKSDTETVAKIEAGINAAIEAGITKFGGKRPNKAVLKLPLRDGDVEKDDPAYAGCFFLNANSQTRPQVVDADLQPILDPEDVYSGCYARASISFYAFNTNGNRGIACGLGNIQKLRDGDPLGATRVSATDDFGDGEAVTGDDFLS